MVATLRRTVETLKSGRLL